jgi:hypothetical protein
MQRGRLVLGYLRDFSFATEPCVCGDVLARPYALSGREVPVRVQQRVSQVFASVYHGRIKCTIIQNVQGSKVMLS